MVRKCRRGVTVMKGVDVRKRSVDEAAPHLDLQEASSSSSLAFSGKKRKINTGDHQFEFSTSYFNLRKRPRPKPKPRPRHRVILPETTRSSSSPSPCSYDNDISTLCYSTQLVDEYSIKFVDLKDENDEVEGVSYNSTRERRETTPSSQFRSEDMESTASEKIKNGAASSSSSVSGSEKMPTHSELEEFFITAEKDIQKHFTKKYNYDVAEDVPLEGRYEWVRLNP